MSIPDLPDRTPEGAAPPEQESASPPAEASVPEGTGEAEEPAQSTPRKPGPGKPAPGVPSPGEASPAVEAPADLEEGSFAELLSEFEQHHRAEAAPGESLEGTVISVSPDTIFVDVGRKREGVLSPKEFVTDSGEVSIKPGDKVRVNVTGRNQDGYYLLSTVQVKRPRDWSGLETAYAEHSVIGGVVTEMIKGGFRVDVGAPAFMPASRSGARDAAEMEALLGQEIRCKVIQLDTAAEDIVVDRRVVLEEEAAAARQRAFSALREGDVVRGTVRTLTDFGAFVDLGGIDGLLHVADMAWNRVKKPSDVLSVGDPVEVKILKVDPENRRISLGRKQLSPDPWSLAAEKYKVGEKVRGKVVRVAGFGAFVQLEPGVDGLIHVSEMSWSRKFKKPSDIVRPGDAVEVVVLSVNPAEKRIALGLKQALGDPWEDIEQKFPVGGVAEGKISNLAKFGAFVELAEGIEGMIHVGDITNEKRLNHPKDVLSEGQSVKAVVLSIDRERKRIRLGLKQLEPTSADEYIADHQPGDVVTGRFVKVGRNTARVELGDGVLATCHLRKQKADPRKSEPEVAKPDLSTLTAMLEARWKDGGSQAQSGGGMAYKAGQVRSFRILSLDARQKKIEIEPAD